MSRNDANMLKPISTAVMFVISTGRRRSTRMSTSGWSIFVSTQTQKPAMPRPPMGVARNGGGRAQRPETHHPRRAARRDDHPGNHGPAPTADAERRADP